MPQTLEERVHALEAKVALLMGNQANGHKAKDWRQAIGLSPNDELMKQIDAAGQAIREKERRRARMKLGRGRRAKS